MEEEEDETVEEDQAKAVNCGRSRADSSGDTEGGCGSDDDKVESGDDMEEDEVQEDRGNAVNGPESSGGAEGR
jgi:hypothetical protein